MKTRYAVISVDNLLKEDLKQLVIIRLKNQGISRVYFKTADEVQKYLDVIAKSPFSTQKTYVAVMLKLPGSIPESRYRDQFGAAEWKEIEIDHALIKALDLKHIDVVPASQFNQVLNRWMTESIKPDDLTKEAANIINAVLDRKAENGIGPKFPEAAIIELKGFFATEKDIKKQPVGTVSLPIQTILRPLTHTNADEKSWMKEFLDKEAAILEAPLKNMLNKSDVDKLDAIDFIKEGLSDHNFNQRMNDFLKLKNLDRKQLDKQPRFSGLIESPLQIVLGARQEVLGELEKLRINLEKRVMGMKRL